MRSTINSTPLLFLITLLFMFSCKEGKQPDQNEEQGPQAVEWQQPKWLKSSAFYSVDLQDFITDVGTNSFRTHVERVSEMGMDAIWIQASEDSLDKAMIHRITEQAHEHDIKVILGLSEYDGDITDLQVDGFSVDLSDVTDPSIVAQLREDLGPVLLIADGSGSHGRVTDMNLTVNRSLQEAILVKDEARRIAAIKDCLIDQGGSSAMVTERELIMTASPFDPSTHDERNSRQALAVLGCTFYGVPVIHAGQELSSDAIKKSLESEPHVDWTDLAMQGFYTRLIALKHRNDAMRDYGDRKATRILTTGEGDVLLAYYREYNDDAVLILLNLSAQEVELSLDASGIDGFYEELFTGQEVEVMPEHRETLGPWNYRIYEMDN